MPEAESTHSIPCESAVTRILDAEPHLMRLECNLLILQLAAEIGPDKTGDLVRLLDHTLGDMKSSATSLRAVLWPEVRS